MSAWTAVLCYMGVFALSAWLLWRFSHVRWYWRLISVVIAFGIGFMPMKEAWNRPSVDLLIGSLFLFFLFWGAGEWAFRLLHVRRRA